jgi:hypothetical protein
MEDQSLHPPPDPFFFSLSRVFKCDGIFTPKELGVRSADCKETLIINILETSEWAADGSPSSLGVKLAMAVERHFALLCRNKTILFSGLV